MSKQQLWNEYNYIGESYSSVNDAESLQCVCVQLTCVCLLLCL